MTRTPAIALPHATSQRTSAVQSGRLTALAGWIGLCFARRRERRQLMELDDAQLRDIGLTRQAAAREAARWPWDGSRRGRRAPDA